MADESGVLFEIHGTDHGTDGQGNVGMIVDGRKVHIVKRTEKRTARAYCGRDLHLCGEWWTVKAESPRTDVLCKTCAKLARKELG